MRSNVFGFVGLSYNGGTNTSTWRYVSFGQKTEAYLNGTEKNTGYAYASNVKINFYY